MLLRALEPSNASTCLQWFSDPEVTQHLLAGAFPLNLALEQEWIANTYRSQTNVVFGIFLRHDGRLIGVCGLHDINWIDRSATFGIVIGEKDLWEQGYGTEAACLLLDHGFSKLNLHRVELGVFDFNARAQRCYEKVGFRKEGCLRQKRFKDGRYCDEIVMSILETEWKRPA